MLTGRVLTVNCGHGMEQQPAGAQEAPESVSRLVDNLQPAILLLQEYT